MAINRCARNLLPAAMAVVVLTMLSFALTDDDLTWSITGSAAFWLFLFPLCYWCMQLGEGQTVRDISNPLEQSWSLYGYALLLFPTYLISVNVWVLQPQAIPMWARQWWWAPAAGAAGFALGWLFRRLDNGRYDPRSLDELAKTLHDHAIVPVVFGALLTRALPVLFTPWDAQTKLMLGFVLGWLVLLLLDGVRSPERLPNWLPGWVIRFHHTCRLVPEKQHPPYDMQAGQLIDPRR